MPKHSQKQDTQRWLDEIPGHSDTPGNKTANQLAKHTVSQVSIVPEPALGIPTTMVRTAA